MTHNYRLELDDYLKFHKILLSRLPWYQRFHGLVIFFPIVVAIILAIAHCPLGKSLGIIFISAQCWAGLVRGFERAGMISSIKKSPGAIGDFTVTITSEAIAVQELRFTINTPWSSLTEITQSQNYLVFMWAPTQGFIIPKASFGDPSLTDEFLEAARSYRRGEDPMRPIATQTWPPPPSRIGSDGIGNDKAPHRQTPRRRRWGADCVWGRAICIWRSEARGLWWRRRSSRRS
ncbi:MAG: hypothetical protein JWQ02_1830 [Capsulimonas sp.]|nr:hypothetical protein [Capsulimonas sp.]